ncbi:MAG: NUDIX pyrophosphatase [Bacteroidetes bacterium]|nr:NUDIX pyrophosphatase [Bacteroidota bacterium]
MASVLSRFVEICVFRISKDEPQYLLLQRSDRDDLYPGIWQIVTGSVEEKEHARKSALREVEEETGLKAARFWTVPFVDSFFDADNDAVHMVPVFAVEVNKDSDVKLSCEHKHCEWLFYEDAKKILTWPGQRKALKIVHKYLSGGNETAGLLEIKQF